MKYIALALLVLATACKSTPSKSTTGKNDTTATIVTYIFNANGNDFRTSAAVRFAIDSMQIRPDSTDVTKNITTRVVDTLYNIAAFQKIVDSAGVQVKTVGGMDSLRLVWLGYEKRFILHDYNVDYNEYLPKVDTAKRR